MLIEIWLGFLGWLIGRWIPVSHKYKWYCDWASPSKYSDTYDQWSFKKMATFIYYENSYNKRVKRRIIMGFHVPEILIYGKQEEPLNTILEQDISDLDEKLITRLKAQGKWE